MHTLLLLLSLLQARPSPPRQLPPAQDVTVLTPSHITAGQQVNLWASVRYPQGTALWFKVTGASVIWLGPITVAQTSNEIVQYVYTWTPNVDMTWGDYALTAVLFSNTDPGPGNVQVKESAPITITVE